MSRGDVSRGGRLRSEVRLAAAAGLVAGCVFGAREALVVLEANAFAQPGQYLLVYLAAPILGCVALALLLALPLAVARGLLARSAGDVRGLAVYGAVLGFAGALSVTGTCVLRIVARLGEVGLRLGPGGASLLWLGALALAATLGAVTAAGVAWHTARAPRPLRWLAAVAVAGVLAALWPVARFLATDWKWGGRDTPRAASGAMAGPNLVLISIDTLRADHVGAYGGPPGLTPQLDRMAAEGVSFRDAVTSAPWTLPAVTSLMTGLYPRHHGAGAITNRRDPLGRSALPTGTWTLATALHARGYRTHAIVTNPYLALRYGLGAGFQGYENLTIESEFFLAGRDATAIRLLAWLRPDLVVGDRGETVSARATAWLTRAAAGTPFFLWLHYIDPHPPYGRRGSAHHKSFRGDSWLGAEGTEPAGLVLTSPDAARLRSGEIRLSEGEKDAVRALYREEVASVDAAVGSVLDALDALGLAERTLVVCVADHGEEFWEHGSYEHGHTVYEELIRIPLMMRLPGRLPRGARVPGVARMTDVAPTILDLLGLPLAPEARDGASLLPVMRGEEPAPRVALVENLLFAEERIGLHTGDRKYVHWDRGKEEVYDLAVDPGEQRDLAGVGAITAALRSLQAEVDHFGTDAARAAAPGEEPPPTTVAALRALGYVH